MKRFLFTGVAVAALLGVLAPAPAAAITYDKLAYLTFSAPVQIPGVTLNAGTYRFRLTDPSTSRNVLQVLSNDGSVVYAMFLTIPDARLIATDEATVTFRETPEGVPPAAKSIFYGGELRGYQFVYPKGGPIMVAEEFPQPEITYTLLPEATVESAPLATAVIEPSAPPLAAEAVAAVEAPAAEEEIAQTATSVPLVALTGMSSLAMAFGLMLLRRRNN
jgi:hypothetical protein